MCGITGFWSLNQVEDPKPIIQRMTDVIAHRGPDDEGHWLEDQAGLALGFRRLSILDLSMEGHQPMVSTSGRYVMMFNGEVYNFEDLRRPLSAYQWRGHSDTEIMLAAIETWGLEPAIRQFNGMFALVLWDREQRTLHLVRDRVGIKPLYYGRHGNTFLFGSELKSIIQHPDFQMRVEPAAVSALLRYGYIPAPLSIYQNVYKLKPGHILTLKQPTEPFAEGASAQPQPFWTVFDAAQKGWAQPFEGNDTEAVDTLDTLLRDAVRRRMVADVPLGAFLSGGIDSSTVVALMQAQSSRPVKTFSIGFSEDAFNEAHHAKAVAQHLGTDHTELYVTPTEAMQVIPKLPALYDEPFADVSQIPTYLVSELARRSVTVSLSGDGGDELFAGYTRYHIGAQRWQRMNRFPQWVRKGVGGALHTVSDIGSYRFQDKLRRVADMQGAGTTRAFYHRLVALIDGPLLSSNTATLLSRNGYGMLETQTGWGNAELDFVDDLHRMTYRDMLTYLPDDILTKVDRASMGVSLEARVPILDHRVVELSWRIPTSMKVRNGKGKWVLRELLMRYVPEPLFERPKQGFGVPIGTWMQGDLKDWATDLLDEGRLREQGLFNTQRVHQLWNAHQAGTASWTSFLWRILMFQAWVKETKF